MNEVLPPPAGDIMQSSIRRV